MPYLAAAAVFQHHSTRADKVNISKFLKGMLHVSRHSGLTLFCPDPKGYGVKWGNGGQKEERQKTFGLIQLRRFPEQIHTKVLVR